MSLAAAMTLGFKRGLFYRNARLHCINLLLTYPQGCIGRCAYCGLSGTRSGDYSRKSFIRVQWPTYSLEETIERISARLDRVKRICISMITRRQAVEDTKAICRRLRSRFDVPVSLLICPTLLDHQDLLDFKEAGADKIGVAVDLEKKDGTRTLLVPAVRNVQDLDFRRFLEAYNETIRRTRGTLTEPGTPSPHRDRAIEESLDLFRRMKDGEFPDGSKVLRARIDMASRCLSTVSMLPLRSWDLTSPQSMI